MQNRNENSDLHDQADSRAAGVGVRTKGDSAAPDSGSDLDATLVDFVQPTPDSAATLLDADATLVNAARSANRPIRLVKRLKEFPVLETGDRLAGRYEILQLLGEGGMGAVYKAMDHELGRPVALKLIRPELAANPSILARFKQELLLAHRVTHKNVVRIYDLGDADGVKFITMEFVDGQ
ncbi:MAG TPA: hypothetical protein VN911_03925, partial [Candidatus Acidoferrum sp.]|nr:hypothetical protein [Candidatus Acidoferrum sp.]